MRDSSRDYLAHEHPPEGHPDLFCLNLASYMGSRMHGVLQRLDDARKDAARWKARHDALAAGIERGEYATAFEPLRANPRIVSDWSLWYHECGHVESWPDHPSADQATAGYGPHPQGCDACESGDSGEGWQKLFVQVNTSE
jgi:hypothetical protein